MFQFPVYNPHTAVLAVINLFATKLTAYEALLNGRTFGELEDQDEVLLGLAIASELDTLMDVAERFGFSDEMVKLSRNGRTPSQSYKTLQAVRDAAKLYDEKIDGNANITVLLETLKTGNDELDKLVAPSEQEQAA